MTGSAFRDFFYNVPDLRELSFTLKASVEPLWGQLCKFVHSDLRSIDTFSIVADIKSVLRFSDRPFAAVSDHIQSVAKIAIACCLFLDPKWLLNVEKVYFDAVFDAYSLSERTEVKTSLRVA